ncbi:MAG: DEAD/DEAH box helicase [Oscillospiraceae bacterium]|nr:DEAD/DEAH box helicase [Oscillospiraceae bacterium]
MQPFDLSSSLDLFSAPTRRWFSTALGEPTAVQREAWPAIAAGEHTLVSAPTGTGKTLSAFLVFIDRMKAQSRAGILKPELQLIYISPLKALAGDIRENLYKPLAGISREEASDEAAENAPPEIRVALRTGDTSSRERQQMLKNPPHILITTPESLFLLLTSVKGQVMLKTARAIIIDELHAMLGSKRGAHLMLSLARLDRLCAPCAGVPLQRIGLSATIQPLSLAAEYLAPAGAESLTRARVTVAAPAMEKRAEIRVTSPLPDIRALPQGHIWPSLAQAVYERCAGTRSVIAFVDGRMYAEKLAYYVNQIAGDGFAWTHHGCVSKEQRAEAENALRAGGLRLLCATSSMELGIDVGDIDRVLQIGYPRSISSVLQRLGRAGHNPGRVSVMHMFPRTAAEGIYCGLTAKVASEGGVEAIRPPRLCLDILAQHLVSMATGETPADGHAGGYTVDDVMALLPDAYPFRDVTRDDVTALLRMLAGDYEHDREIPVRPRILYDRIHQRVEGDAYSRMLAVSAGGTIPDTGMFAVRGENGVKLGELDEEYVFEARVGDKFLLGSFAWKILRMDKDTVTVAPSNTEGAQPPFWKNTFNGRGLQTGLSFGRLIRGITDGTEGRKEMMADRFMALGMDWPAALAAAGVMSRQMSATGLAADDRTVIVEHFADEAGDHQVMVHAIFGKQINAPLSMLVSRAAKQATGMEIGVWDDDDGFLLFPYGGRSLPEGLLQTIPRAAVRPMLEALLPSTPLFNMNFRYGAARALMMGVRSGKRQPLWVQRLRGAEMLDGILKYPDHPLIRETKRECLEDCWDIAGVEWVLDEIAAGRIAVREVFPEAPSPLSLTLRRQAEATLLYDYSPTPAAAYQTAENAMDEVALLPPAPEQLARLSERRRQPVNEAELHTLLMTEGDILAGELDLPLGWLESLARQGRAAYVEPGLWIAAEMTENYAGLTAEQPDSETVCQIVRRSLRYRGGQTAAQLADRYAWSEERARELLHELTLRKEAVEAEGVYFHAELYDRARHATIQSRRKQITTRPGAAYAALAAVRIRPAAPPEEQLEAALDLLCGRVFPAGLWEKSLLPARVGNYRPAMLDTVLAKGDFFWRMEPEGSAPGGLAFHRYEEIDWDAPIPEPEGLEGDERAVFDALRQRGASFLTKMSGLIGGRSPAGPLIDLTAKGLVRADSFAPVRQWLQSSSRTDKQEKMPPRARVSARVSAMTAGRWELDRPLLAQPAEQLLSDLLDKTIILSKETLAAQQSRLSWSAALELLRVWEYTGRVRRGYFVEGLSGAQFISEQRFAGTMLALEPERFRESPRFAEAEREDILWLPGSDPAQLWGRVLPHKMERNFLCVPATAVALAAGAPAAVLERSGAVLRVFEPDKLAPALAALRRDFAAGRIFPQRSKITVKQYPPETASALAAAGFMREMGDYSVYKR